MLDELLRPWHWRTKATMWMAAPPAAVFLAAEQVRLAELPGAASIRARESRGDRSGITVMADLFSQGFFLLEDDPDASLVLGRVGEFWRPGGAAVSDVNGRRAFVDFNEPGYAKALIGLQAIPSGPGTMVIVESRVLATDTRTFREFNRYWLVGAWANPAGRHQLLQAIRARVEGPVRDG